MKYHLGYVRQKFWLQNGALFLSCVQTVLLSASYDNIILKAKQVICLESLYLKKGLLAILATGYEKLARFERAKPTFSKFAYSARAVHEKKRSCKSQVYMNNIIIFKKITTLFTVLVNYSAGARCTKWIANLVPNVLSLALCNTFFGCYSPFQIPAPLADNKWGGILLSSLDRVAFVIATIIYSSSPPLFLAPRFWELSDLPHPGFFLEAIERTLEVKEPGHCKNKKEPRCVVVWSVAEK